MKYSPSKQSQSFTSMFKRMHILFQRMFPWAYDYERLVLRGNEYRPHYAYMLLKAVKAAQRLGIKEISVFELGCAGGSGLVDLEYLADKIKNYSGVGIKIYGFDTSVGLPKSNDVRDCLYLWRPGDYVMDLANLKIKLVDAELVLGDVAETIPAVLGSNIPVVGVILVDLDYYTSTIAAISAFASCNPENFLPRTVIYLDDTLETSPFTGELGAVNEFNHNHENHGCPVNEADHLV